MDEKQVAELYEMMEERMEADRERVRLMRLNGREVELPRNVVWDDSLGWGYTQP